MDQNLFSIVYTSFNLSTILVGVLLIAAFFRKRKSLGHWVLPVLCLLMVMSKASVGFFYPDFFQFSAQIFYNPWNQFFGSAFNLLLIFAVLFHFRKERSLIWSLIILGLFSILLVGFTIFIHYVEILFLEDIVYYSYSVLAVVALASLYKGWFKKSEQSNQAVFVKKLILRFATFLILALVLDYYLRFFGLYGFSEMIVYLVFSIIVLFKLPALTSATEVVE